MKKFKILAAITGIGLIGIKSSIFCVDPGEKALIIDNFEGLKQKIYG